MDQDGFADLVHQAEQLTADMDSGGELPHVERNLHQIMEAAQRMASKAPLVGQESTDVKASLLLARRGYDVQKISHRLEGLSAAKTFEPLEPVRETDIHGFLKNERENALLAAIEQARKNTFEDAERRHWDSMENEWEREKQRILNALVGSGQDMLDFPLEPEGVLEDTISMQGRSTMDSAEMAYSKQIYIYNDQVIQGGVLPSLTELCKQVSVKLDDKNVEELWNMVDYMTNVPMTAVSSVVTARTSQKMQLAFVNQALKYLEKIHVKYITNTVQGNLQQAKLGGIPSTYHLVRSFLNIKNPGAQPGLEDGVIDGHPLWAMIYYCIRCGDYDAAMQIVNSSKPNLGEFPAFLREYISSGERRLSHDSRTKIQLQYRRSIRNGTDPYKRAVYCVLGCCAPNEDHAEVADKIDDYLWLKLSQLSIVDDDDNLHDSLTLTQLQRQMLEEYGETHFNAYQKPFLYFEVLLLTAQFEAAIEFLSRLEKLRCHAVHVALVLYEMKLLLLPSNMQTPMLSQESMDPPAVRRLNFARLVMMYTRKFEATDPREALQYFYFLRDLKTTQGENMFMQCVSELVLETREFEMLLGQLARDGSRKPGAIDKFKGETQKIIELVAKDSESKGLFEDAVKLYDLSKNHEKVLELMNKLLTQHLSQPSYPDSARNRLQNMATAVAGRYRSQGLEGMQHTTSTFYLLLDLMTFFDLFHAGKPDAAYDVIHNLKLLPFTLEAVDQKVQAFKHYTDEVRRSLPEILLATMNILHQKYQNIRNRHGSGLHSPLVGKTPKRDDGGREQSVNYLRSQARALITFAGMIPYRMPGDTNARLVQIEVLMN